jgi:hypothetical protein
MVKRSSPGSEELAQLLALKQPARPEGLPAAIAWSMAVFQVSGTWRSRSTTAEQWLADAATEESSPFIIVQSGERHVDAVLVRRPDYAQLRADPQDRWPWRAFDWQDAKTVAPSLKRLRIDDNTGAMVDDEVRFDPHRPGRFVILRDALDTWLSGHAVRAATKKTAEQVEELQSRAKIDARHGSDLDVIAGALSDALQGGGLGEHAHASWHDGPHVRTNALLTLYLGDTEIAALARWFRELGVEPADWKKLVRT